MPRGHRGRWSCSEKLTMHDGSVLDLGLLPEFAPRPQRSPVLYAIYSKKVWAAVAAIAFIATAAALTWGPLLKAAGNYNSADRAVVRISFDDLREVEAMTVDDKSQIVVEGLAAQQRNAALPISAGPLDHMRRFLISTASQASEANALKCLTQAVYYESANEPMQGRRAVAQVVLNRMRHPAYPKSVCGVVYQGSERRTGCQFSFTCDGSLLRRPSIGAWHEAEAVASAALAGYVEPSVGTATHYHADYVLPKWAFQLGKITQLGRHIFYRFTGSWGRSAAFTGHYSGIETIPALNAAALQERLMADGSAVEAVVPGLTVPPHVTDRHAEVDVGGRLDVTKEWRLTIPDPTEASSRYRQAVADTSKTPQEPGQVVLAERPTAKSSQ